MKVKRNRKQERNERVQRESKHFSLWSGLKEEWRTEDGQKMVRCA